MRSGLQAVLGVHGPRWVDHLHDRNNHTDNINNIILSSGLACKLSVVGADGVGREEHLTM